MKQAEHNKAFILKYYSALYGVPKTETLIRKFVSDQKLIDHILYFDKIFPDGKLITEEIIAEADKVFVKARLYAKHTGEIDGIPPTYKEVEIPFAICYKIQNERIIDFWTISDQVALLKQLEISREEATA